MNVEKKNMQEEDMLRKKGKNCEVYIDSWCPGINEQIVPENELQPGEISAVINIVACYKVRNSWRVYVTQGNQLIPAEKEIVDLVRKKLALTGKINEDVLLCRELPEELHVMHEISAKHNDSASEEYIKICGAEQPREANRIEYIGDIYAVKENEDLPDEYASLLVYSHYSGSSYGIDTWYKLAPTGKKSKIVENPFSSCMKEKTFVESNPMLYDRLRTISAEYSVSVEMLMETAVKRLIDDIDFVRGLRMGKTEIHTWYSN